MCCVPAPEWLVPVKNIGRINPLAPNLEPLQDVGATWAACDECALMTVASDLNGLVSRYRRGPGPDVPVRLIRQHFENFLTIVLGPPRKA
jgi:hypothetical protein